MENKINIAELLKDCPQGMELDCTMYDNCTYAGIEDVGYIDILINTPSGRIRLTKEGCYIRHDDNAKCVIFPKGKTTWEGFVTPIQFKDGDIVTWKDRGSLVAFIYKERKDVAVVKHHFALYIGSLGTVTDGEISLVENEIVFATEEEKQKLFDAIKANGYKWNAETKTLEKLIEPKFKVGDRIKYRGGKIVYRIVQITEDSYVLDNLCSIPISIEHMYNLVSNKFDINTLVPFESKVLVRHNRDSKWCGSFFSHIDEDFHSHCYKFVTTSGRSYPMCIPYEGNEHLLGTTNDCDDFYKTWE